MDIAVDQAQEAEDGEEVLGRAGKLEVRVGLKRITQTATRISVRVQEDFFSRDKATARKSFARLPLYLKTWNRLQAGRSQEKNKKSGDSGSAFL